MFEKILIPIDGSDAAHKAVIVAKKIVKNHCSSKVILLHVLPVPFISTEAYVSSSIVNDLRIPKHEEFEIFKDAEEVFKDTGITINKSLERGYASSSIVDVATEEQVDLIVIGSRGLGGLKSFFLGSVSKEVVNEAPCAVLVVK